MKAHPQPGGFALLDPLVGILLFAAVMVGAINFWRLAQVPIISTRSATADVEVRSGCAAVIGGITEDIDNYLTNGVTGLRRMPILGYLFSNRQKNKDRTNLIIIVWPRIVQGTFERTDRLGQDEVYSVDNLADLPGEPPPIPSQREGKQAPGKRSVYFQQGQKSSKAPR
jgi:Bacterial type II and III secretion system protein